MEAVMKSKRMKAELNPNGDWSKLPLFDRAGWKQVRFADVVHRADGRYDRASANLDIQRWVAGEHIDEGDLHIHRESFTNDALFPPTFGFTFKAGHVLLHSRNPKKVAVPHFDGITGEKLFVLKPKDESALSKDFLPFVLLSEHFQKWAVENSSGSVNKFLNWSALERYSFALPPLDQQRRIAALLWAVDEDSQSMTELSISIQSTIDSLLGSLFPVNGKFEAGIDVTSLQELCAEPISYGIVQAGPHVDDGIPYIRVSDMTSGPLRLDGMLRTEPAIAARFKRSTVRAGELVCALRGPAGLLSLVPDELDGANLTQGTARISLHDKGMTQYVLDVFESPFMRLQLSKKAKGSTFTELTLGTLREIEVPVLKEARRERFGKQMNGLRSAKGEALGATRASRMFLEQLLNTL